MDQTERLATAIDRLAAVLELMLLAQQQANATTECPRCGGRGWRGNRAMACDHCDGSGQVAA